MLNLLRKLLVWVNLFQDKIILHIVLWSTIKLIQILTTDKMESELFIVKTIFKVRNTSKICVTFRQLAPNKSLPSFSSRLHELNVCKRALGRGEFPLPFSAEFPPLIYASKRPLYSSQA